MKLTKLIIKDFRGLTFDHDFKDDKFVVITGINGSGKSTVIDAVSLLLTQQSASISEQLAQQATAPQMEFEVTINAEEGEVDYLAKKLHQSQPNNASLEQLTDELKRKLFVEGVFKRKFVIIKPDLGWKQGDPYVKEFINDTQVNTDSSNTIINANSFTIISRHLLLKLEQLENLNLNVSMRGDVNYSIQDIFNSTNENSAQRIGRTNFSASPLLDSLITYEHKDESKLNQLIDEYDKILDPVRFKRIEQLNGLSHIAMIRNETQIYTIDTASSGQKKAIVLATLKYIWKTTALKPIVLLDEPENSMHPELTSRIFEELNELARDEDSEPSFIIATHSAEVVAANPSNTYRIITTKGTSSLAKISSLEDRAAIITELGVKFSLDYVAQKIVFVEGQNSKQGIDDGEAYQTLIDPIKERVLFINCGPKSRAEARFSFQRELMNRLNNSSNDIYGLLTDRDGNNETNSTSTPFWDVEYLYLSNSSLLARVSSLVLDKPIDKTEIERLFPKDIALEDTRTKDIWQQFVTTFKIDRANAQHIQRNVLKEMREDVSLQSPAVAGLITRYH